jgi:hypothetical protein
MANLCPVCNYNLENNVSGAFCDACKTPFKTGEAHVPVAPDAPGEPNNVSIGPPPVVPIATAEPRRDSLPGGLAVESKLAPEPSRRQGHFPAQVSDPSISTSSSATISADEIDAKNAFEKGKRIITVIGFANSGKSFFVNRLRNDLVQGPWRCAPGPQDKIATSPEGLELTRLTPFKQRRGQFLNYVVVDLAGESFMKALDNREGQEIAGFSIHSYLAAMAFASAYIFLIRFEDIRGLVDGAASDESKKVRNLLANFHAILGCIAVSAERLRRSRFHPSSGETPEKFLTSGISKQELDDAFDGRLRCDKPICVLFSQADRVVQAAKSEGFDDNYDCDPLMFAMQRTPGLYNPISDTFRNFRFDFLSAFEGHVSGPRVNYRLPSHGALEAFLWIHGFLDYGHSFLGWPSRLMRGLMPTRQALRVRRWLDPKFGEVLQRIESRGAGL